METGHLFHRWFYDDKFKIDLIVWKHQITYLEQELEELGLKLT